MNRIKILLVDDHELFRDGLSSLLRTHNDFQIVGSLSSGEEAISQVSNLLPDVILMDIMMEGLNGIQTTDKLKRTNPEAKVILISMEANSKFIEEGIKAGAMGYLPKSVNARTLTEAIQSVYKGEQFFSDEVSEIIFKKFLQKSMGQKNENKVLSKREIEVLREIALGHTNKEVGEKLFISTKTVDTHRSNILQKLDLKTTADLVRYAIKNQIADLDE